MDGITWSAVPQNPFYTYSSINALAFGDGRFVAGGSWGKMAYSRDRDAIKWTRARNSTFDNSDILDIAYGNGRFVAVGDDGKMAWRKWQQE